MANEVNIDISKYLEEKMAGTAALVKLNGVLHYTSRKFNVDTGVPVPVLVPMDQASIEAQRDRLKADLATFEQLVLDCSNADEKLTK